MISYIFVSIKIGSWRTSHELWNATDKLWPSFHIPPKLTLR